MANLTIIDGHSYIYGAFYGVPDKASDGKIRTDAIYGFFALLRVIINAFPKNKIIIVFDSKKWFARHKKDSDLESLLDQQAVIQKILNKIGIRWVQDREIKADNIIASIADTWAKNYGKVQISSGDFDFVQLISTNISLARNLHGLVTKLDTTFIKEKFGISPQQYIDFQSIVGDKNDGFVGVPGLGPKRAAALLNEYRDIAGIYKNIEKLPASISEKLRSNKTLVLKNQKNIPMNRKVPVAGYLKNLPDFDKKKALENVNTLLSELH